MTEEWDGHRGRRLSLACILSRNGHRCRIEKLSEKLDEESAYYANLDAELGVPIKPYHPNVLADCEIIVDYLLGTGFHGCLRAPIDVRSASEQELARD